MVVHVIYGDIMNFVCVSERAVRVLSVQLYLILHAMQFILSLVRFRIENFQRRFPTITGSKLRPIQLHNLQHTHKVI